MLGYGLAVRHRWFLAVSLALLLGLLPIFAFSKPASGAGTLPDGFEQKTFASGLTSPTAMTFAPDGRLFVAEQAGTLQDVNTDGTLQKTPQGTPAPFLDISSKVTLAGERGLLGVPFDPDFANNPYVYVYYTTVDITVHYRVARFTASEDSSGKLVAATNSETPSSSYLLCRRRTITAGPYTSAPTASSTWQWARTPDRRRPSP
jgi:hypothetical protein